MELNQKVSSLFLLNSLVTASESLELCSPLFLCKLCKNVQPFFKRVEIDNTIDRWWMFSYQISEDLSQIANLLQWKTIMWFSFSQCMWSQSKKFKCEAVCRIVCAKILWKSNIIYRWRKWWQRNKNEFVTWICLVAIFRQ